MSNTNYTEPIDIEYVETSTPLQSSKINTDHYNDTAFSNNSSYSINKIQKQIDCLDMELYSFGFTFEDISQTSPPKKKDKYACADMIRTIIDDRAMMRTMLQKGYLPIRLLSKRTNRSPKLIASFEGYVVMASLILTGNYPDLKPYFDYVLYDEL